MEHIYVEKQTFNKFDFTTNPLKKGEYVDCLFKNCDFSNTDLTDFSFIDCEFLVCNISLAKLSKTTFRSVKFKECKMLGLLFFQCNEFGLTVDFDTCILNHSSFFKRNIKKTSFLHSKLIEVDFTQCDLSATTFDKCDLLNAKFENTILEKADLRTAFNYSIDPEINRIKKAKFSLAGISGLLDKYNIEIENM